MPIAGNRPFREAPEIIESNTPSFGPPFPILVIPGAQVVIPMQASVPRDQMWEVVYLGISLITDDFTDLEAISQFAVIARPNENGVPVSLVQQRHLFFGTTGEIIVSPLIPIPWGDVGPGLNIGISVTVQNTGIVNRNVTSGRLFVHVRRFRLGGN